MPYPTRLLNQNEQVALDLRPHWWYFSKHILTGIPLFVFFLLVLPTDGNVRTVFKWVWIALAVLWGIWLVVKYFDWRFTYFVVTSERVIYRTGVIARHGVEIPLSRINNINFNQGVFNRVIGAGDLEIESAGREGTSTFDNVRHPDGVQQEIYRQMESRQKTEASWVGDKLGAAAGAAEARTGDAADRIRELSTLLEQGHITPEEYEAKKAELLGRI